VLDYFWERKEQERDEDEEEESRVVM